MAVFNQAFFRAACQKTRYANFAPSLQAATSRTSGNIPRISFFAAARRSFSSFPDPYKTLGLSRDCSEADLKKAYKKKALEWHPDKQPEEKREEAQKHFAEAANAYEILKDPDKRREYDLTGQVGGGSGAPGGGFHPGAGNPADVERIFREAFGEQSMQQIMQQLFQQQQMRQQQQQQHPFGCGGFPQQRRRRGVLEEGMEVRIRLDVENIHTASRKSNIGTDYDERRARYAGKLATIIKADPKDQSIKVRVMVSHGRADELWFGAGAVWDPSSIEVGMEVQISPDVATVDKASRESGIDAENDGRRARCVGKIGTVVSIDRADQSAKLRVAVLPGRADEVWFGDGAFEPLLRATEHQHQPPWSHPHAADMRGFSSAA
mmetsp:Transcript_104052/g.164299  ORF Transcript_104052/g.164299 Transcript_104052/m.164299 type:complete len:378 (-) Transcript_104052:22-1155(-)